MNISASNAMNVFQSFNGEAQMMMLYAPDAIRTMCKNRFLLSAVPALLVQGPPELLPVVLHQVSAAVAEGLHFAKPCA
jgi:hypothetical protein